MLARRLTSLLLLSGLALPAFMAHLVSAASAAYLTMAASAAYLTMAASAAGATERIVIGAAVTPPLVSSESNPGFLDTLATEAFRRLGIELKVVTLPAERVLVNTNRGIEDGVLLRIAGLERVYPNLVRVPEKMMDWEFVGYSTTVDFPVTGWRDLAPYVVGYINGWKIFDANVKNAREIVRVRDAVQLFGLLRNGRADIVMFERWQGLWLARRLGVTDVRTVEPAFENVEMFMYLHNKHAAPVPEVARSLAGLKQDGTYRRIYARTLEPLLSR